MEILIMKKLMNIPLYKVVLPLMLAVALTAAMQVGFTHISNLYVDHDMTVGEDLTIIGGFDVDGATTLDALDVDGATTLNSTLDVDGAVSSGTGSFTVTDTANITGAVDLDSTLNVDGAVSSATGAFTVADATLIDGAADVILLTVQGYTTQTTSLLVLEQSDGTDVATVSNVGNTDVAGTLQFGADDNYALGYASSAQELACVSTSITGTAAVAVTGVTTPTFAMVSMVTDPGTGAGDPAMVTFDAPSTTTVVVNVWQDDFTTAATSTAVLHVCAIGNE